MTQTEVDLIYDYLHENYIYKDGYFINKNKGTILYGSLEMQSTSKKFILRTKFRINKKTFNLQYNHAIWIYFNKEKVKYLNYIDGNSANNKIENLKKSNMSELHMNGNFNSINRNKFKGVLKDKGTYYGVMYINNKKFYSKACKCPFAAHLAYLKMKKNYEDFKTLSN